MTDKEKIRAEIERLLHCPSYHYSLGAFNALQDILSYINSLPEEPVSNDFEMALAEMIDKAQTSVVEPWVIAAQWKDELIKLAKSEEPVSEDLEEAIKRYLHKVYDRDTTVSDVARHFAKWQKANLWKPADGDDLPEIDREVIVLTQPYPLENSEYAVSFAHRPNSDGWDGKSLLTGKVEHYTPKTYDKGGWNLPNVKYWLDVVLPKEIEL